MMERDRLDGAIHTDKNGSHPGPAANLSPSGMTGALELVNEISEVDIDLAAVHDALAVILVRYHHATRAAVNEAS